MLNITRNKLTVITILLLSITLVAPLCGGLIATPLPLVPGAPAAALKVDLTNITPTADMQQVNSNSTKILYYRNVTLAVNSTRTLDLNITLDDQVKPRLFALSVMPEKNVSLTIAISHAPAPGETAAQRDLNFYIDIKPNATISLQAQMKLNINATLLGQELNRQIVPAQLTWLYWNSTQREWVSVPSHIDQNGYLVCNTNHLSTWTIAENTTIAVSPSPSPTETTSPSPEATVTPSSTTIIHVPDLPSITPSPSTSPESTQPIVTPSPSAAQSTSPDARATANNASSDNLLAIGVAVVVVVAVLISAVVLKKKGIKRQTAASNV